MMQLCNEHVTIYTMRDIQLCETNCNLKLDSLTYEEEINLLFTWTLNSWIWWIHVGNGCLTNGIFKLNVIVIGVINKVNKSSIYFVEYLNFWYEKFGNTNFQSLHKTINIGLLPNLKYIIQS